MDKHYIKVPDDVQYLSAFKGFELPNGILQKVLTGCGGTTLALTDSHPTIICSPRTKLLENKHQQLQNTFLLKGGVSDQEILDYINSVKIPKILTTYDSFYRLKFVLDISLYRIVVDEFQFILSDSSFKLNEEKEFLDQLRDCNYVTYLSATPIVDKYLNNLSHFDNIPYYELVWDSSLLDRIEITSIPTNNSKSYASKLIKKYKEGRYIMEDDNISKEIVFFVNSVKTIVNLIKGNGLSSEEVNIIVADNERNNLLLKKLGSDFLSGYIPNKGEPHKMFTFCTSTAFAGVDFYSTNAVSIVISDCYSKNTSIDIATDLVQIAGRQRLSENPFRKKIIFVYNTNPIMDSTRDEFYDYVFKKVEITKKLSTTCNLETDPDVRSQLYKMYISSQEDMKYENYMYYDGSSYILNDLAMVNEIFCYDIQKTIFKSGLAVRKELNKIADCTHSNYIKMEEAFKLLIQDTTFEDTMKKYCELRDSGNKFYLNVGDRNIELYYNILGSVKIKSLSYKESAIKKEIESITLLNSINSIIRSEFKIGEKYSKQYIKDRLIDIYSKYSIHKNPKASDLDFYFDIESTTIRDGNKIKHAFLIKEKK